MLNIGNRKSRSRRIFHLRAPPPLIMFRRLSPRENAHEARGPKGCLLVGKGDCVMNALTPLGMVSDLPSENQMNTARREAQPGHEVAEERTDYFVQKDGMTFAGTHLLVDYGVPAASMSRPGSMRRCARQRSLPVRRSCTAISIISHPMAVCPVWWCSRRAISQSTPGPSAILPRSICSCAACAIRTCPSRFSSAPFRPIASTLTSSAAGGSSSPRLLRQF